MPCPDLLLSAPPSLSEQLRKRTNQLRSKIIRTNYNTQFTQNAAELTEFRDATARSVDAMDDDTLSEIFQKTVHFTTYESYAPFTARLLEKPCKASAVVNLLAPGLPDYIAESSLTFGRTIKSFPKYECISKMTPMDAGSYIISDSLRRRTAAIGQFCWEPTPVEDDNGYPIKTIRVTNISAIYARSLWNLHPEQDREKMGTFILDHAAPYATHFIPKMRSFLLIHALFAIGSKSLETIMIPFSSMFVDMMRHLDTEFDMVVDCLASGTIPDLDGLVDVRHYLEMNILPDPERAAELRSLGRPSSQPGWCGYAWPNLRLISTIASGSFATYVPLLRWFLGSNVELRSLVYGCSEGDVMALPYNPLDANKYKLADESVLEFLDIAEGDSIRAVVQAWEAEVGKRYEVILTTQHGLWRYSLGDLVEVSGFDPTDGVPVIQFIERRHMVLRFPWLVVTETELRAAISTIFPNATEQIVSWTAAIDNRRAPATIGFFVELVGDQTTDLTLATHRVLEELSRTNIAVPLSIKHEVFRKPTIRLVERGTFFEFLQLKLDEANRTHFAQIKVPSIVSKEAHVTWLSSRVVREL